MQTSEIIRSLRQDKEWSQKEMAEKLHMSVNGYSKIERGESEPNLVRLKQIADALGVPLQQLLPQSDGALFLQIKQMGDGDDNSQNVYNPNTDTNAEIEKLKLIIRHKDELLNQQARELETMQKMLALLNANHSE